MRGDLGPLLGADSLRALGREAAHEPQPHGARISPPATSTTTTASKSRAPAQRSLRLRNTRPPPRPAAPRRGQARSGCAGEARPSGPLPARRPRRLARSLLGLVPHQRRADGDERHRPHQRVPDPQPPGAEQQQDGRGRAARSRLPPAGVPVPAAMCGKRRLTLLRRDQRPQQDVERGAPAPTPGPITTKTTRSTRGVDAKARRQPGALRRRSPRWRGRGPLVI